MDSAQQFIHLIFYHWFRLHFLFQVFFLQSRWTKFHFLAIFFSIFSWFATASIISSFSVFDFNWFHVSFFYLTLLHYYFLPLSSFFFLWWYSNGNKGIFYFSDSTCTPYIIVLLRLHLIATTLLSFQFFYLFPLFRLQLMNYLVMNSTYWLTVLLLVVLIVGKDLYIAGWRRSFKYTARHIVQEIESLGVRKMKVISSSSYRHTVLKSDSRDANSISLDTPLWSVNDIDIQVPTPGTSPVKGPSLGRDCDGDGDIAGRSYVWNALHHASEVSTNDEINESESVTVRGAEESLTGRLEASL